MATVKTLCLYILKFVYVHVAWKNIFHKIYSKMKLVSDL